MKLKKILLASAIVASLAGIMATSSFAEEAKMTATWDAASKSVIIENCPTAAARKTLLVLTTNTDGSLLTTVAEENIKQIDEQADAYTKVPIGDIADGTYEVRVGGDGTIASALFTVGQKSTRLLGDVTGDSSIDINDASGIIGHITGVSLEGIALKAADVNKDTSVDVNDASAVVGYVVGMRDVIDGTTTVSE